MKIIYPLKVIIFHYSKTKWRIMIPWFADVKCSHGWREISLHLSKEILPFSLAHCNIDEIHPAGNLRVKWSRPGHDGSFTPNLAWERILFHLSIDQPFPLTGYELFVHATWIEASLRAKKFPCSTLRESSSISTGTMLWIPKILLLTALSKTVMEAGSWAQQLHLPWPEWLEHSPTALISDSAFHELQPAPLHQIPGVNSGAHLYCSLWRPSYSH